MQINLHSTVLNVRLLCLFYGFNRSLGLNLNVELIHHKLVMNLNADFQKSINLNLNVDFLKLMNLNLNSVFYSQ